MAQKRSKEVFGKCCVGVRYPKSFVIIFAAKVELNCPLHIPAHLEIAKYSNIAKRISKSIGLRKDGGWRGQETRCKEVLGGSLFLVTRPGSAAQTPPSQLRKEAAKKLKR